MALLAPLSLSSDQVAAVAALVYQAACVSLLVWLLHTRLGRSRLARAACGLLVALLLLGTQPLVHASDTQPFALTLAVSGILTAWSMLHWACLEPLHSTPSFLQLLASPILHMGAGARKVHQRALRRQGTQSKSAASMLCRPVVVVQATDSDEEVVCSSHPADATTRPGASKNSAHAWRKVTRAAWRLLVVSAAYDCGLFLLCTLTPMCTSVPATPSRILPTKLSVQQLASAFQHAWVAFAAIMLMGLVLDFFYCWAMLLLCIAAVFRPSLVPVVESYLAHAFDRPLAATSIRECWSHRWHQLFRFYFEGLGHGVVDLLLPRGSSFGVRVVLYTAAAFVMSGLLHEYLGWAATGHATGMFIVFVAINFTAVIVEAVVPAALRVAVGVKRDHIPSKVSGGSTAMCLLLQQCWVLAVALAGAPFFIKPLRIAGYYARCTLFPFGVHLTPWVLAWVVEQAGVGQGTFGLDVFAELLVPLD